MNIFFEKYGNALYFSLCMIVFLFFVYAGQDALGYIDSPHIVINTLPIYFVIIIVFLFTCSLFFTRNSRVDVIFFCLLLRLLLHFSSIEKGTLSPGFGINFTTSVLALCTYLIALNQCSNFQSMVKAFRLIFTILVLQIFLEFLMGTEPFWGNVYLYKHDMTLPIGSSNALASKLIPLFVILYAMSTTTRNRFLLTIVTIFAIVLTKSRGGVVDLIISLVVLKSWDGNIKRNTVLKFLGMSFLWIIFSFYFFSQNETTANVFSHSDSSVVGRIDLWKSGVELFLNNILFGAGFYEDHLALNPHNFIIDILMRSGLVGMFLFIVVVSIIFFDVKNYLSDSFVRGCFIALLCLMWHGLVEIVLFSYIHDIIIWCFVGCMIARARFLKKEHLFYDRYLSTKL